MKPVSKDKTFMDTIDVLDMIIDDLRSELERVSGIVDGVNADIIVGALVRTENMRKALQPPQPEERR
jgi:hypothetical protein